MKRFSDPVGEEKTLRTERLLVESLLFEHTHLLHESLTDERLYRAVPTDAPESVTVAR